MGAVGGEGVEDVVVLLSMKLGLETLEQLASVPVFLHPSEDSV